MPPTEVKLDNCSKDALFKAVSDIRKDDMKCILKTVKDMHCRANSVVQHVADTSDYYIPKTGDAIKLSKIGNPTSKDWLPEHLCHNKIFHVDEVEMENEDTSLQATMMASATSGGSRPRKPETQDRAATGGYQDRAGAGGYQVRTGAGGGSGHTWKQNRTEQQTPAADDDVNARKLRALNDLKSDVGIIKKAMTLSVQPVSATLKSADTQPRQKRPGPGWRSAEQENQQPQQSMNSAGIARMGPKGPKAMPRPLTNRTITRFDSYSDGYECASMDMADPIPKGKLTSYRDMDAIPGTTLQPGFWKQRPADDQHSEGELQPAKLVMTIEGSPDGKSPPVPNSSTTINPKDPYGKPFSYEVESLEYGQSKDMVITTAEHTSDRSSTRAHVFDSDSGRWIVPELYSPTNVSLGNVPGYDNYIAPEPKEIVEPARTRLARPSSFCQALLNLRAPRRMSTTMSAKPTLPAAMTRHPNQYCFGRSSQHPRVCRHPATPNTPVNRSVRVSPCIPSLAGAKPLHGTSGEVPFGYHPGDM